MARVFVSHRTVRRQEPASCGIVEFRGAHI